MIFELIRGRLSRHPSSNLASGVRWERLTPTADATADFLEVIYAPGATPPTSAVRCVTTGASTA